MFIEKFKVHPIGDENAPTAETFATKIEADKRADELNKLLKEGSPVKEWVVTSILENEGW